MPRVSLTDKFVAAAKTEVGQADYFDAKCQGLVLRVSDSGLKTWCLFFTAPKTGKRARSTLGRYPPTSLADARTRALEANSHLDEGIDPRDVAAGAMTVSQLVSSYMAKHVRPNLRSAKAVERRFTKNVLPLIGGIELASLHRRDINRVIDNLVARDCPTETVRVFQDLRALLRWGAARGDIDRNPIDGMKMPTPPRPRERVLSEEEIAALWKALPSIQKSVSCQRIIKLCLLTGQRVGEVSGMRLSEIDLRARVWIIPSARSKNKHTHTVPLSVAAISIIEEARTDARGDVLFPDVVGKGSLRADAVSKTITKAEERIGIAHWTAHDLRRTAVTGMAKLGVSPIVLGHVINHRSVTRAGVTLAVYQQYDYAKEKREALELWAERLNAIIEGSAKVLSLRGAR
jgi:integrase